ncbi:MAG: hypothetical protein GY832_15835 [Chloroflexi bacterium]|nr:hypothetical protein [Chloroflexota bacterium]
METWTDRMKLFAVLSIVKVLLETVSENEGWSFESPDESLEVINGAIAFFLKPSENKLDENISMQFAPTGPLQEISISNGWSELFLKLADEYDRTSYVFEQIAMGEGN